MKPWETLAARARAALDILPPEATVVVSSMISRATSGRTSENTPYAANRAYPQRSQNPNLRLTPAPIRAMAGASSRLAVKRPPGARYMGVVML